MTPPKQHSKYSSWLEDFKKELGRRIIEYCETEPVAIFDMDWVGEEITQLLNKEKAKAEIEGLKWGKMQFSGLDKSHVGRSYYNRNTAFKNYSVKFWNGRAKIKRDKFDERIAQLEAQLSQDRSDSE